VNTPENTRMDYNKLDAELIAQLDEGKADASEKPLSVFIHTTKAPGPEEESFLKGLGHSGDIAGREVFTAALSPGAIDKLSSQPWVRYVKLSRQLRPVDEK
jgi:hypothetical protein